MKLRKHELQNLVTLGVLLAGLKPEQYNHDRVVDIYDPNSPVCALGHAWRNCEQFIGSDGKTYRPGPAECYGLVMEGFGPYVHQHLVSWSAFAPIRSENVTLDTARQRVAEIIANAELLEEITE